MPTSEQIEKARKAAPPFWRDTDQCEKHIAKMLAAAEGVKPRVKPLVWHKSHMPSWNDDWHTIGPFTYTIRCADENGWKWTHGGGFGYAPSPDSCKAFAQVDYEARILAALEPTNG